MKKLYDVTVAGHICIDLIPKFNDAGIKDIGKLLVPGKLVNVNEMTISGGGPVCNTGLNIRKLGKNVNLMGKVGDDFLGKGLKDLLKGYDAEQGMITVAGETTSYTVVVAPPGIDRIFLHNPGANDTYSADDVDYDEVEKSKMFHLGYPPLMKGLFANDGRELVEIFKRVKERGVTTSLDMTIPDPQSESGKVHWRKVLENLLPYVDLYVPSVEETMYMLDSKRFFEIKEEAGSNDALDYYPISDIEKMARTLLDFGSKVQVLKSGHRGAYVKTASRDVLEKIEAMSANTALMWADKELWGCSFHEPSFGSATGSGDSFIASFLVSLLNEKSLEETMRIGNCVGCQNVTAMDAVSPIRTWDETIALMDEWKQQDIKIDGAGWEYDSSALVWRKR